MAEVTDIDRERAAWLLDRLGTDRAKNEAFIAMMLAEFRWMQRNDDAAYLDHLGTWGGQQTPAGRAIWDAQSPILGCAWALRERARAQAAEPAPDAR